MSLTQGHLARLDVFELLALIGAELAQPVPEGQQPGAAVLRRTEAADAGDGAGADQGVAAVGGIQLLPLLAQLVGVTGAVQGRHGQRAQQAVGGGRRDALVLGQQPRGAQRVQRLAGQARGLQAQAQRTAEREAAANLSASEARLSQTLDAMRAGVWDIDLVRRTARWSGFGCPAA